MNESLPCFCAFVTATSTGITCGEAIINGEKSYIIHDAKEDRWYEAIMHGSMWRVHSYEKIQEVFWNKETGGFFV